ncbi:23S rRNA (guanosine(2251)-2'-O)-methyltransferase RlmB [Howardella ureilytica]|nr:23S rRNA (guanosine(2251)-2'-O)-methyltransferase RlmB [Lachnospiraceae bacterium]MDY2956338.1 23S rRNA (guanosine(2251)-2'-O)-methyltransferase RlmB [Lachnospiraceae bacterium]
MNNFKKNNYRDKSKSGFSAADAEETQNNGQIEGRNPVIEAFRAGVTIDKVFLLEGCRDGAINTILREAKKNNTIYYFVSKERLNELSLTGHHQGVIAKCAENSYGSLEDIFAKAQEKGEPPFVFILDEIEDPHNLGAIIRTANVSGAHGVIIEKRHAAGITPVVVKTSAGATNFTPVVKVTNINRTIEELKEKGLWIACADMDGENMYKANLSGAIGIVIGNEGSGVSKLVRKNCDFTVSIPVRGEIESLNASVAAGVLAYEVVRARTM